MAAAASPVNGFSVDVEDWYQVADFDAVVAFSDWDRYESRVARNTDRLLALLDEAGVTGTFFVLTWNAERHPEIVRRIAAAGHEIASHGYAHRLIYEQTPETFRADVSRASEVRAMFDEIHEVFGRLDILVNNAGVFLRAPFLDVTEAQWDDVLNINLKGTFLCAQAAGRVMTAQQSGVIVNLASGGGLSPRPGYETSAPYAATDRYCGLPPLTCRTRATVSRRPDPYTAGRPSSQHFVAGA